jgi:3-dehydroquinate synthase
VNIKSATKTYEVTIHNDFAPIHDIVVDEKTFVVIDKTLYGLYKDELFANIPSKQLYVLEATEEHKVVDTALEICEVMTEISAKRNTKLISFGGGIVQDVTGFVANILYRGVHWTFFPTTLLAGCDSCIGGKTSLNYKKFKNLLGTFYPPDAIHVCTPFFKTLSEGDFKSGLGEVVKFNVMQKEQGVANMEAHLGKLLERDDETLRRFVESSLAFKKNFIEVDEFDRGERIKLNFAHTFGHAFETVSNYAIPHGTAVAMGTIVANHVSLMRGWLEEDIVRRMEQVLIPIIPVKGADLNFPMDEILSAIHKDKKQTSASLTAVLMKGEDMELQIVSDVTEDEIQEAINYLFGLLK